MSPGPARRVKVAAAHRRLLLATLGGLTFSLAAPPTDFLPTIWVGLSALYLASMCAPSARSAAFAAWLWATSAGLAGMAFVPGVIDRFTPLTMAGGVLALVMLAALQALCWALAAVLAFVVVRCTGLDRRLAFAALVLGAISLPTVISWTPADLLSPWPAVVQLAEFIGARGVSALIALTAALLAAPLEPMFVPPQPKPSWPLQRLPLLGLLLLGAMAVHGAFSIAEVARTQEHRPKLRIGVVQAAIAPTRRWDPEARDDIVAELRLLTVQSERRGAALTLWPEAAYPHGVAHARSRMPRGPRAIVGGAVRGPVLTGALTQPAGVIGRHNAAILVRPDGFIQMPQAKLALLWFGESVPFGEYLPSLRRAFSRTGGLVPGHEVALLSHGPARIGVLNCYEDTLPGISRHIARAEPNLLVNLTNDAWFAPSSETELHLRLSALRAVETRRDLLRAVNLGLPAWIDSAGRIRALGKAERKSVLVVDVALNDESPTLYTKVGDVVAWLALGLATAAAWLWSRRRARQPATAPGLLDSSKRSRGPSYSPASPE